MAGFQDLADIEIKRLAPYSYARRRPKDIKGLRPGVSLIPVVNKRDLLITALIARELHVRHVLLPLTGRRGLLGLGFWFGTSRLRLGCRLLGGRFLNCTGFRSVRGFFDAMDKSEPNLVANAVIAPDLDRKSVV